MDTGRVRRRPEAVPGPGSLVDVLVQPAHQRNRGAQQLDHPGRGRGAAQPGSGRPLLPRHQALVPQQLRPFVLALSAASLLYIAMSDLIPGLHRGEVDSNAIRQVVLIAAGIGTIVLFERALG